MNLYSKKVYKVRTWNKTACRSTQYNQGSRYISHLHPSLPFSSPQAHGPSEHQLPVVQTIEEGEIECGMDKKNIWLNEIKGEASTSIYADLGEWMMILET